MTLSGKLLLSARVVIKSASQNGTRAPGRFTFNRPSRGVSSLSGPRNRSLIIGALGVVCGFKHRCTGGILLRHNPNGRQTRYKMSRSRTGIKIELFTTSLPNSYNYRIVQLGYTFTIQNITMLPRKVTKKILNEKNSLAGKRTWSFWRRKQVFNQSAINALWPIWPNYNLHNLIFYRSNLAVEYKSNFGKVPTSSPSVAE